MIFLLKIKLIVALLLYKSLIFKHLFHSMVNFIKNKIKI